MELIPVAAEPLSPSTDQSTRNTVCSVCGGRAMTCAMLGHRPESDRHIQWNAPGQIIEVLPTKIWIENGVFGERAVMVQHEGMEPFEYAVFNYRYGYTDNLSTFNAAESMARSLGATEPIEHRQRGFRGLKTGEGPQGDAATEQSSGASTS